MQPIDKLLAPYLTVPLSREQIQQLQLYLDLLLKWNARINLTAVRDPAEVVRRHFGESLFAGRQLQLAASTSLIDVGSGPGFPGLPIKILAPQLNITLIEARQKKATFLREAVRALAMKDVIVHAGRAESLRAKAGIVTLRAVEKFEATLGIAAPLVEDRGCLALLIGISQAEIAAKCLPKFSWQDPIPLPNARERILLLGTTNFPA